MPKISNPGQILSWNNFLKKPGQELPPVRDKLPWYHQLFWCFEMSSPFFGPRFVVFFILFDMSSPNPSWAPASCSLPKVHPPKNKHGTWKWGPLGKGDSYWKPSFSRFHVEFPECRRNLMKTFYWNCQLQVKKRTSCTHLSLSTSGWIEMADPKPGPNRNIKKWGNFNGHRMSPHSLLPLRLFLKSNTRPKSHASINGVRMKWSMLLILGISHQFWTLWKSCHFGSPSQ